MVLAALAAVVVGVVLASALAGLSAPLPRAPGPAGAIQPAATPAATHGDLVVTNGETFNITTPLNGNATYYQGGNVTVDSGGTLILHGVTFSFVEFVGSAGTPQQRLSHIYHFLVNSGGTVEVVNSTITTDLTTLSTYGKLNLTVEGAMSLENSALAFAGWIRVTGATANLTLTNSTIEGNPQFPGLLSAHQTGLNATFVGDTGYAPNLNASAGGQVSLFHSLVNNTYQNNVSKNGTPAPLPLTNTSTEVISTAVNVTQFLTATDTTSVTQDLLYANEIQGGTVTFDYTATVSGTVGVVLDYGGHAYRLGLVAVQTANTVTTVPFNAALIQAINTQGAVAYLNYTGDFGVTPSKIAISIANSTAVGSITGMTIQLLPRVSYNVTVTGAGSRLSTVDSTLDLSFYAPNGAPEFLHQLQLTDGATAFLGNLSIPNAIPTENATAAITADATSTATLFRWASFNLTGSGGVLEVDGGQSTPYYAYGTTQANNLTVNGDNAFATSDPAIAGYLKLWDKLHERPAYGESGVTGVASLLLATNQITGTSGPDGDFFGDYNISVTAPTDAGTTAKEVAYWGGVSPYPAGVAFGTNGYQATDFGPTFNFPQYSVKFEVTAVTVLANGAPDDTVHIGQTLGVQVAVKSGGAGPIGSLTATLYYDQTEVQILAGIALSDPLPHLGSTTTFTLSWVVTTSITGTHSNAFGNTFWLTIVYNNDTAKEGGGLYQQGVAATIAPTTSPLGVFGEKFLGLELWLWLAIAAGVVVVIVGLLFFFRRQAGGKLVECGECGNLIPENATVCPKCGAEFETDVVRCSRCSSTIPASSKYCPECAVQLLGKPGEEAVDPERQAYADFTERYRAEAKKALGDNYTEGAFWDWWKRQPSYLPYGQWRLQQGQGTPRTRATAPPPGSAGTGPGGAPRAASRGAPPAGGRPPARPPSAAGAAPPATSATASAAAPEPVPAAPAAAGGSLKPCPNCSKEIPSDYLVCPFCGSVTQ